MFWICFFLVLPEIIFGQITEQDQLCRRMVGVSKPLECRVTEENKRTNYISRNCWEILKRGNHTSGTYEIKPHIYRKPFTVFCDMETQGGGWTVIQNRFDGSVDFYKEWRDYKFGFGDLKGEFWIGLENIHLLTALDVRNELLIELVATNGTKFIARYTKFNVGPEKEGYILKYLGDYSGNAEDSLSDYKTMKFSTQDMDQDNVDENCAVTRKGAWWYDNCGGSNLNGKFLKLPERTPECLEWNVLDRDCLAGSRILIRPRQVDFNIGILPQTTTFKYIYSSDYWI